jgi:hypothetical protein
LKGEGRVRENWAINYKKLEDRQACPHYVIARSIATKQSGGGVRLLRGACPERRVRFFASLSMTGSEGLAMTYREFGYQGFGG